MLIAPIVVAAWLYSRARARAALEPPTLVVVGPRRPGIRESAWGTQELAAVFFLAAGALLLPVIGPLVGMVLVWTSTPWTAREKGIATAIGFGGILLPVLVLPLLTRDLRRSHVRVGRQHHLRDASLLSILSFPAAALYLTIVLNRRPR